MRKKVVLLGSTGSVGRSSCKVLECHKDKFEVKTLAANVNCKSLLSQAVKLNAPKIIIGDERFYELCRASAPADVKVAAGTQSMCECVCEDDVDIVICAIAGSGALEPVLCALQHGKTVALASKEVMLLAGDLVMKTAAENGGTIIPVDSEHSAIFQCMAMHDRKDIKSLWLTCSGGPFRKYDREMLEKVTLEQALKHPVWSMGRKITIDSASLMNKALEVVEAAFLFGLPQEKINVVIHPEGIIHSLVEFEDNSMGGYFSNPSMELPIQYALSYPDVIPSEVAPLNLAQIGALHFEDVNDEVFPSIKIARRALDMGKNMPLVMNCANEVAVRKFCRNEISFEHIWDIIEGTMAAIPLQELGDLSSIREAEFAAVKIAENL